ncbi:hypothetical protein H5410_030513 [Solanum commersonii]|uniref:Uncharacterized protein n=1 Tax=Solanum commersonii TaxID=4109 RepID=A0A9J5YH39_SOLCO|nr:hypothetical protein H5410_030513 [Solanum commersonii]
MIIPEKIEKQKEIQKIEIPEFYARKRIIGLATILNELATNYLSENAVWSYYAREQTMIYSNCRETRPATMEEIRQWVLSLLKSEQKPTTRAIRQNFISTEIMTNYCKTIGHKYLDHQFKVLWRRQYNSSCQSGIKIGRQDNGRQKIVEEKAKVEDILVPCIFVK